MITALAADTTLYKFKAVATDDAWNQLRQLIVDGKAYFARPSQLNDIFECKPQLTFEGSTQEKINYIVRLFDKFQPDLSEEQLIAEVQRGAERTGGLGPEWAARVKQQTHDGLEQHLGIFCLSEALDHPLMWAHYGLGHTGVCLGFHCAVASQFWARAMRVDYKDTYPVVNLVRQSHQEIAVNTILIKGKDWAYEREWRIVDFERGAGVHEYPQESLRSVTLGTRFPDSSIPRIREFIREARTPIMLQRAVPREGQYGFAFSPVGE